MNINALSAIKTLNVLCWEMILSLVPGVALER